MSQAQTVLVALPALPASVGRARRAVREALDAAGAAHLADVAQTIVSELVSNALVHAGTPLTVRIGARPNGVRVEVADGDPHLPARRTWPVTAGTGRGLVLVDELADRWDAVQTDAGKVVWFELGEPVPLRHLEPSARNQDPSTVKVVLLDVPLLMHWAWQQHATTLLREYLLYALEHNPRALDEHAAASDALRILEEQLPSPMLPSDPAALMAGSVEPDVTKPVVVLHIPWHSVAHFALLDDLLDRAIKAAVAGDLMGLPTQPEMVEMRHWLCAEVRGQAGATPPTPWRTQTDPVALLAPDPVPSLPAGILTSSELAQIATNAKSVIIAVTPAALEVLGYRQEAELLGRRILVVVPPRYHQAHIAGTTLNATNGRSALLHQWIEVPMITAGGHEKPVRLRVEAQHLPSGEHVFIATIA